LSEGSSSFIGSRAKPKRKKGDFMQSAERSDSNGGSGSIATVQASVVHKATGPRTEPGKQRSKQNALKHGIFSQAVVLEWESRAEYDSLLRELQNDIKPVGS
jgi:hypothetical protein